MNLPRNQLLSTERKKETDRQKKRQFERKEKTDRSTKYTERERDRQTDRQTERQTDKKTDRRRKKVVTHGRFNALMFSKRLMTENCSVSHVSDIAFDTGFTKPEVPKKLMHLPKYWMDF